MAAVSVEYEDNLKILVETCTFIDRDVATGHLLSRQRGVAGGSQTCSWTL